MPKHADPNKKKAAIYVRVSTKWQAEDGDSLPMQRDELSKYAQYALGISEWEIFEDAGYSAKNTERPDFQRMMSRIRSGEFTHIIVWKLDRISRNLLDFAAMYAELKKLGVTFVSKNEQFDTSTAIGEAMLKIILVFAELERNMTSERVSATLISRAQGGQWNGGKIPFGYAHEKGTDIFTINEPEAVTVRLIYDLYEEKRSLMKVAKYLNEHSIKTRSGVPWNPTTVSIILTSPFYIGTYRYNYRDEALKTFKKKNEAEWVTIVDHHPAIIELDQQQRVLDILANNDRVKNLHMTYERKNTHIFAGLIFCGACGSQYQASIDRARAKSGWRPSIYMCARHRRFGDCKNKYVSDATLGPFMLNFLGNYIKAQRSFGKTTDLDTLEKKLLRGEYFEHMHIDRTSLNEIHTLFRADRFGDAPLTAAEPSGNRSASEEKEILAQEKGRLERALLRLKTLFLYSADSMPEKEFVEENKNINERLSFINERLTQIEETEDSSGISDELFMQQASYLIITQELTSRRYVNYEKIISILDKKTLKYFINSVLKKIVIFDGKVTEIQLKNGISVKFLRELSLDI